MDFRDYCMAGILVCVASLFVLHAHIVMRLEAELKESKQTIYMQKLLIDYDTKMFELFTRCSQ